MFPSLYWRMTVTEDEEFEAMELHLMLKQRSKNLIEQAVQRAEKRKDCQHRWEQTEFGKRYWAPGTWQYTCSRCGAMNMIRMETT